MWFFWERSTAKLYIWIVPLAIFSSEKHSPGNIISVLSPSGLCSAILPEIGFVTWLVSGYLLMAWPAVPIRRMTGNTYKLKHRKFCLNIYKKKLFYCDCCQTGWPKKLWSVHSQRCYEPDWTWSSEICFNWTYSKQRERIRSPPEVPFHLNQSVIKFVSARLESQISITQYKHIEILVNINSKLFHYIMKGVRRYWLQGLWMWILNTKNTKKEKQCSQSN